MNRQTKISTKLQMLSRISAGKGDDFEIPVVRAVEIIGLSHGGSSREIAKKHGAYYDDVHKLVIKKCDLKKWIVSINDKIED